MRALTPRAVDRVRAFVRLRYEGDVPGAALELVVAVATRTDLTAGEKLSRVGIAYRGPMRLAIRAARAEMVAAGLALRVRRRR